MAEESMAKELYEALVWKVENQDFNTPYVKGKVESLVQWYEQHKYYTMNQRNFIRNLLGDGIQ